MGLGVRMSRRRDGEKIKLKILNGKWVGERGSLETKIELEVCDGSLRSRVARGPLGKENFNCGRILGFFWFFFLAAKS